MINLAATVDRVLCERQQGSRYWLMLKSLHGVVKGNAGWVPKVGERVNLRGVWEVYNGEKQFKFSAMVPDVPDDSHAKLHYACEITPGLGEGLEERIWTLLEDAWPIIAPGDVPGVTEARCAALRQSLEYIAVNAERVRTSSYLMARGATFAMAEKAWDKWGEAATGIVTADCFRLAELHYCGFRDVDTRIRQHYGIGDGDPRRIRAGIRYALGQVLADGSTVAGWAALRDAAGKLLGIDHGRVCGAVREMLAEGTLVGWAAELALADAKAAAHETIIWEYVTQ